MLAEYVVKGVSFLRHGTWGLVPVLILMVYTYVGAVIFQAIERPHELRKLNRSVAYYDEVVKTTTFRLSQAQSNQTFIFEQLQIFRNAVANETYLKKVRIVNKTGVYPSNNVIKWVDRGEIQWSIWGSVYYAMTIYTTIGYGNICPETWVGKLVTVIYALIGIPLALISLISLGSLMARFWLWIWLMLLHAVRCLSKDLVETVNAIVPVDEAHNSIKSLHKGNHEELLRFPLSFLLFLTLFWILFSAALFNVWLEKDWSFRDYIPSKYDYIIVVGFLLLGGLALISTVITILQKQIGAVAASMYEIIDKEIIQEFGEFLQEITEIRFETEYQKPPPDDPATKIIDTKRRLNSIHMVVNQMAWKRRAVYNMMSRERKQRLEEYMKLRMSKVSRGVQTEESLIDRRSLPFIRQQEIFPRLETSL